MRIAVREVRIETDDLQKLLHALGLRAALREVMHLERLADDVPDGHARVERRVRILEDHLHPAAHATHLFAGERRELGAIELHRSRSGLVELEDRASGRRFAAAGLSDEAERLAPLDEEIDPVDGAHRTDLTLEDDPLRQREVHLERLHREKVHSAVRRRGRAAALHEFFLRRCDVRRHSHLVTPPAFPSP